MRPPRAPSSVQVTVTTDGAGLAEAIVRRFVKRAAGELAVCAPRDLQLALVIDPSGAVAAVAPDQSPAGRCAARVLRAIRFLRDANDAPTHANIRLQLVE